MLRRGRRQRDESGCPEGTWYVSRLRQGEEGNRRGIAIIDRLFVHVEVEGRDFGNSDELNSADE